MKLKQLYRSESSVLVAGGGGDVAGAKSRGNYLQESANGDLSSAPGTPTALTLSPGVNSVIGVTQSGDQDWVALTVPTGYRLTSDILAAFTSVDTQGFTGVQAGSSFVGSSGAAGSYLGYAHYGTAATNGSLPPTNLIGVDLLPLMGNTALAAGSQGFTPPLAAGTYTFLIQQTGASTAYQFDFTASPVPEPGTAAVLGLVALPALLRRKRA